MRWFLGVVLLVPVLAGCVAQEASRPASTALTGSAVFSVVGMVDTGINPYHEMFQDSHAELPDGIVDARTGARPIPVKLSTTGNASERYARDEAVWASLEPDTLYWFVGTRLLAMSPGRPASGPLIYKDGSHGTGVASMVRDVSHDAWIVMVPDLLELEQRPGNVLALGGPPAKGIAWLASQPWVDVISLSLGYPGNPPVAWNEVAAATRDAAGAGKLVVSAAGDEPLPNVQTGTSGPPWVVSVGGAEPSTHGVSSHASLTVDVVSDYTHRIAARGTDGYLNFSGTSFSAPLVAGVVGEALLHVRRDAEAAGAGAFASCVCAPSDITEAKVRAALNATAVYWTLDEWQPLNYSTGNTTVDKVFDLAFVTEPVGPAPWLQMGWGYVGSDGWRALAMALEGHAPPAKPGGAVQFMAEQQALREAYWGSAAYRS